MWKSISIMVVICFLFMTNVHPASAETQTIDQKQQPSILERAFPRELGTNIILEIMSTKGDNQLYFAPRIEKITRNEANDFYDITLRVIGYEGPMNPPYTLIHMTIRIPGNDYSKYTVLDYKRRFISDSELKEFIKFAPD
ncbi:hypothetical protein [Shouchella miscanthi]|uniref:hypothetical protein n=1 Tax=Shouchella miscanthi TaxID=2598861 RepID=UPI0011A2391B|nr:hypothetical protein [Shouchella miscanthi]